MLDDMSDAVRKEFIHLFTGEKIGSGAARDVYELSIDNSKVVKIENRSRSFQNIKEWEAWQAVKDSKFSGWFCPCLWISYSGSVLIQERTSPAREHEYPERIPAFFTDTKRGNFGLLNGRFVAHDYGMHLLMEHGMTKRMRKADWWE